jgi:hypothetical protein
MRRSNVFYFGKKVRTGFTRYAEIPPILLGRPKALLSGFIAPEAPLRWPHESFHGPVGTADALENGFLFIRGGEHKGIFKELPSVHIVEIVVEPQSIPMGYREDHVLPCFDETGKPSLDNMVGTTPFHEKTSDRILLIHPLYLNCICQFFRLLCRRK